MTDFKATDEQIIEALKTMSVAKAAKHFGMNERSLWKRKAALARKGWSPEHDMSHTVPDGFHLKGTSSLYKEGQKAPVLQWVKTSITKFRYWYLGHVHHLSVKEYAGVTVESFNTLTAKDAYAAFGGYRAQQNMKCIVMHSEFGEVSRHTVSPIC